MNTETETINRLLEIGGAMITAPPLSRDGDPFTIIPKGLEVVDMARFYPPERIKAKVTFRDAESFTQYVGQFKAEGTMLFADLEAMTFVAILDYHTINRPAYTCHRAHLVLHETEEFKNWIAHDRERMGQVEFAEWLEDAQIWFRIPSGAALLELITSLHGHVDARFNQTFRPRDGGCKLLYDEDVVVKGTSTGKGGEMDLPENLQVGMSPLEGSAYYEINARLKVRIESRRLVLWYETSRKDSIVKSAMLQVRTEIQTATGLPVLLAITGGLATS